MIALWKPMFHVSNFMQVGHEVAHAVARHSSEKLSLGILTVASQLAFQVFQVYVRQKQGPTQGRGPGGGAQGMPVAWYNSSRLAVLPHLCI